MIFVLACLLTVNTHLALCINSVINVKMLVDVKALVGAFSVIVKTSWTFVSSSTKVRCESFHWFKLIETIQMFRNFPKLLKTLILSVALPVAEFAYKIRIIKNSHKKYKRTSNFN